MKRCNVTISYLSAFTTYLLEEARFLGGAQKQELIAIGKELIPLNHIYQSKVILNNAHS